MNIKYKGKGEYLVLDGNPLPAKDLTTEDYDALNNDQRKLVRESALYDYEAYRAAQQPAEPAKEGSN
jgi:hypothetical protein